VPESYRQSSWRAFHDQGRTTACSERLPVERVHESEGSTRIGQSDSGSGGSIGRVRVSVGRGGGSALSGGFAVQAARCWRQGKKYGFGRATPIRLSRVCWRAGEPGPGPERRGSPPAQHARSGAEPLTGRNRCSVDRFPGAAEHRPSARRWRAARVVVPPGVGQVGGCRGERVRAVGPGTCSDWCRWPAGGEKLRQSGEPTMNVASSPRRWQTDDRRTVQHRRVRPRPAGPGRARLNSRWPGPPNSSSHRTAAGRQTSKSAYREPQVRAHCCQANSELNWLADAPAKR